MTEQGQRMRSIVRAAITLTAAAALYELLARSGYFAPALLPTIPAIVRTLIAMLADGSMIEHAAFTMYRVMFGFGLAVAVGIPLGILMARFQRIENFFLPLVSALMPIPSFALVPLFMLWFGIGNLTTILIVFYAATFPMVFNTWSGVRSACSAVPRAKASRVFTRSMPTRGPRRCCVASGSRKGRARSRASELISPSTACPA